MTENEIEIIVANRMDSLDRDFLKNRMDSDTYDRRVKELNSWADAEYRKISLAPFRMEA